MYAENDCIYLSTQNSSMEEQQRMKLRTGRPCVNVYGRIAETVQVSGLLSTTREIRHPLLSSFFLFLNSAFIVFGSFFFSFLFDFGNASIYILIGIMTWSSKKVKKSASNTCSHAIYTWTKKLEWGYPPTQCTNFTHEHSTNYVYHQHSFFIFIIHVNQFTTLSCGKKWIF